MKRVEKLFIIHTADMTGGGSQSIRGLIRNLNEDVDLLIPVDGRVNNGALRKFYGKNVRKIYRFHLPFRRSTLGLKLKRDDVQRWVTTETEYWRDKKRIYELIRANRYRVIHLNSYVLYPLLTSQFPMFIHIREIFDGGALTKKIVQRKLKQAKGIIYIDYTVKEFMGVHNKREIVLNNPFDQSAVLGVDQENVRNRYHLQKNKTLFAFISVSAPKEKGMDYVIDEFIHSGCTQSELLIVGQKATKEYQNMSNVHFLGKIEKMEEIYAVSDFVIRGDMMFAIGRTIYEALYSGCHAIIPGVKCRDKKKVFEYDRFARQITFYEPRAKSALSKVMKQMDGKKKEKCLGLSNEKEYIERFYQFIGGTKP